GFEPGGRTPRREGDGWDRGRDARGDTSTTRAGEDDREAEQQASRHDRPCLGGGRGCDYFRCLLTSLVISNMLTEDLPPNTVLSVSSALIIRLFLVSCSLFFLMYAHSRLVTSVRGIGLAPTTSCRAGLGFTGRMNAALGFRA